MRDQVCDAVSKPSTSFVSCDVGDLGQVDSAGGGESPQASTGLRPCDVGVPIEVAHTFQHRDFDRAEQYSDHQTFHPLPRERFVCRCGTASCRGVIGHEALPDEIDALRHRLEAALAALDTVDQPLASLLRPGQIASALETLRRGR